jgi:ribonuclease P protein component
VIKPLGYTKQEHIVSKKQWEEVWSQGKSCIVPPLKVFYVVNNAVEENKEPLFKFSAAVSKRNFKKAVQRNYLKRRIKEAVRLQKPAIINLLAQEKKSLSCIILYLGTKPSEFNIIQQAWINLMPLLKKNISEA